MQCQSLRKDKHKMIIIDLLQVRLELHTCVHIHTDNYLFSQLVCNDIELGYKPPAFENIHMHTCLEMQIHLYHIRVYNIPIQENVQYLNFFSPCCIQKQKRVRDTHDA